MTSLFDLVNDAIIIVDKLNLHIIFCNEKGQKFAVKNSKTPFAEYEKIKSIVESIQPGNSVSEHINIKIKNKVHHYKVNALAFEDHDASLIAFVITDTTRLFKLHRQQQQLISQIRKNYFDRFESLKQLADSIAHEVRNPLVSIGGYANLLIRRCQEEAPYSEVKKYLHYIVENAERLNYLTQQIEEMGDLKRVQLASCDITTFLHEQKSTFESAAYNFNKQLILTIESEHHYRMYIDHEKLRFALTRIIEFIAQHSNSASLPMRCHDSTYEFFINLSFTTDILAQEDLPYLFDPFFTTRSNVETFNLCIAQRIVMLHGGIITPSLSGKTLHLKIALPQDKRLSQNNR